MYNSLGPHRLPATRSVVSWIGRAFSLSHSQQGRIGKILIANRGEIACRVMRTANKLGVETVAVYSDVDRNAMHVGLADEAYNIGSAASSQSYLKQETIIEVALKAKCQAIHPGYGFLSENAEFAELCQKSGIIFVGPPASAIRDMGIKSTSKKIMDAAGVPVIAGYHGDDQSDENLLQQARKIGFPLMIKAVRGGGGKGMRIASEESKFLEALESARLESQKAFGDSAVLLEQYVSQPRHVEVQIFADKHGNAVHLFERDCSVQRRHQKVIEEAPAPGISHELRLELGAAAVRAAKAVGYVGAGTVEFILDRHTHKFHFMEMNTRLQVEHPVTEAVTGTDLVEWQLRVAAGEKLPFDQEQIRLAGHAFEARIYAEDPEGGFLPGAGLLEHLSTPEQSTDVRVETGVKEGDEVSVHYDPMIAKLVVWGKDRAEALAKLRTKLCQYNIAGLETNVEFIKDLASHPTFQSGDVHTGFIEENYASLFPKVEATPDILYRGTLAMILEERLSLIRRSAANDEPFDSPFTAHVGLRLNHTTERKFNFSIKENKFEVDVKYAGPEEFLMRVNNSEHWSKVSGSLTKINNTLQLMCEVDGIKTKSKIFKNNEQLHLFTNVSHVGYVRYNHKTVFGVLLARMQDAEADRKWQLTIPSPKFVTAVSSKGDQGAGAAVSPMPGIVDRVLVNQGDSVAKGDPLLVIIAMKMEHVIKASKDGRVTDVLCSAGDSVAKNKLLVKLDDK